MSSGGKRTAETLVSRGDNPGARGEKRSYVGNIFFNTLSDLLDPGEAGALPADPFKSVITTLQCLEFSHDKALYEKAGGADANGDPTQQEDIRLSSNSQSYLSLVALGDTRAYSLNHLMKLVSTSQLNRIIALATALREALGSLQTTVKTRGIECVFMDIPTVTSCLAEKYSQPRYHMQNFIVEGVITNSNNSPFDDCINLYVRRILEEAFQAEQSEDIVSSYITVTMGRKMDKKQIIDVRHISARRQQVISILKAATVGEGEVSMNILIKLNRTVGYFDLEGQEGAGVTDNVDIESSTGFMKIVRRYNFSYRDDKGFNRCFARYPFDSLARGVFLTDADILLYKNVYRNHASKVTRKPSTSRNDDEEELLGPDEPLFLGEISQLVKEAKATLRQGEFVNAGDLMLVLGSFYSDPASMLTKISRLISGDIGRVHSARNSLAVIMEVSTVLEQRILETLSGSDSSSGTVTKGPGGTLRGAGTELISLLGHFKTLSEAHIEFKRIILTLVKEIKYSEFQSIKAGLVQEMWELFDEEKKIVPITDPTNLTRDRNGMVKMIGMIRRTFLHLHRLKTYLHVLEATLGSNVMLFLIRLQRVHSKQEAHQKYHWTQLPMDIRDLLGYIDNFDKGTIMTSDRDARTVSRFLNAEKLQTQVAFGLRSPVKWDDIVAFLEFSGLEANFLWASTTVQRPASHFAELKYDAMLVDELSRHESPKFMVEETAKVRYLIETHVLRALQEAAFSSFTRRTDSPLSINANMSIHMTRYSNYLTIEDGYDKQALVRRMFTTARIKGAMHLQPKAHGACKIKIMNKFINSPKAQYSAGGVYGCHRILTALGYNAQNVFTHVWMIPPLFDSRPNTTPGLSMSVNVGISARSAFHWGMPKKRFHNTPVKPEQDRDKKKKPQKMDNFYTQLGVYSLYHFPEPIELEVVLKYSYELASAETRCRKSFGYELSRCCSYLSTAAEWKLNTVTIPHLSDHKRGQEGRRNSLFHDDDDDERDTDLASETVYTSEELEDRGADLNMQVMAGKHSFAVLNCAVLFPDHATGREEELLDMVSKIVSTPRVVTDEQPDYDRTGTDIDRVFADENSACGAIQRYMRERKVPRPYVPCRINFTMVATERVRLAKGKGGIMGQSKFAKNRQDPGTTEGSSQRGSVTDDSKGTSSVAGGDKAPRGVPGLAIGQQALNRLIARTIWFSPQACANIWSCSNGEYRRCYSELAETELESYRLRKLQGRHLQALDHLQMNAALTCQYDIFLECAVRHSTVVSSLHTVCAYIESTRSILIHNSISTINLNSLQRTLLLYVGLGLRLIMLAPDCVQLRGGCFLILHRLQRFEQLLGLMPDKLLLPDKTEFVSMEQYAQSRNAIVSKEGVTVDNEKVLRDKEFELRKAMGSTGVVEGAVELLGEILAMSHTLLESLGNTVDADLQTLDMRMKFRRMTLRREQGASPLDPHVFSQHSKSGGETLPPAPQDTFSNANDPNATFDSSHLGASGGTGAGDTTTSHRNGYQLPASINLMFSTEGIKGKDLEELMEARRDWIQREQYEDTKDDVTKASRRYRPLLQVAMADSRFNSKSTRYGNNLTEAQKDVIESQTGGAQGPLLPPGRSAKSDSNKSAPLTVKQLAAGKMAAGKLTKN